MKKIFFLSALLCASMMSWATQYCDHELKNNNDSIRISCEKKSGDYVVTITANEDINGLGGSFVTLSDGNHDLRDYLSVSVDKRTATITMPSYTAPNFYTPLYVLMPGEVSYSWPADIEWGKCGEAKEEPELTITAQPSDSLNADTHETFTITVTRKGDGAITYESASPGIASVGETSGVITAVGRGSTTITVRVAETETYEGASKQITVYIKGAINWPGISWLANSEQYKLVIDPEISDGFGGKRVEGENLWVGFPSADFGACSIEYSALGAGVSFALSNFPQKTKNQFTMVCAGTTYTFYVYNDKGTDSATSIDNTNVDAKTVKVIENGQLIIIKNGVRYNALGAEVR